MNRFDLGATIRAFVLVALLLGSLFPPYGTKYLVAPAALATVGLLLWDLFRTRRLPVGTWFIAALFAVLAVSLLWHPWGSLEDYGQDKTLRLFTLTLLTAAAATLIRGRRDLNYLARGFVVVGAILAAIAILGPVDGLDRAAGLPGTNPLWLARAIGLGLVAAVWLYGRRLWPRVPLAVAGLLLVVGLYLTESRGPALGTIVALAVLASAVLTARLVRSHPIVAAGAAVGLVAALVAAVAVSQRYLVLLTDPTSDASTAQRIDYWSATFDLIAENPGGIGYGAWNSATGLYPNYPHNIFLEVYSEAGWAVGVAFTALVAAVAVRLVRRYRRDPAAALVLALFAVEMVAVMLSGNINARTWFFLLALGWVVTAWAELGSDGAERLPRTGSASRDAHPADDAGRSRGVVPHPVTP